MWLHGFDGVISCCFIRRARSMAQSTNKLNRRCTYSQWHSLTKNNQESVQRHVKTEADCFHKPPIWWFFFFFSSFCLLINWGKWYHCWSSLRIPLKRNIPLWEGAEEWRGGGANGWNVLLMRWIWDGCGGMVHCHQWGAWVLPATGHRSLNAAIANMKHVEQLGLDRQR